MTSRIKDISRLVKRAQAWEEKEALEVAQGLMEHYSGRHNWDDENWIVPIGSDNRVLAVVSTIRAFAFVRFDVPHSLLSIYPKVEWQPFSEYSAPEFSMEPNLLITHFGQDETYQDDEEFDPTAFSAHTLWFMTVH